MQLTSPLPQNTAVLPFAAMHNPPAAAGSEPAAAGSPSHFARLLESRAQAAPMATPLVTGSTPPANRPAEAPHLASKEGQVPPTSRQDTATSKTSQGSQTEVTRNQDQKLRNQQQNERNRLQAQRESRSSETRGPAQPTPTAASKTSAPSKPATEASDSTRDEESIDRAEDDPLSPLALLQWLQVTTIDSANMPTTRRLSPAEDAAATDEIKTGKEGLQGSTPLVTGDAAVTGHPGASGAGDRQSDVARLAETAPDPATPVTRPQSGRAGADPASSTIRATTPGLTLPAEASMGRAADSSNTLGLLNNLGRDTAAHPGTEIATPVARAADGAAGPGRRTETTSPSDFATLLSAHTGTAPSEAASPVSVNLQTPVQSPAFREQLSAQVSLLAKDGVQNAELHLNPADMGPISVQITLDGTQARVDFGADSASTRQLIESGLPELASALREAGLTLTGGGVSQHAGGRSGQNSQDDQRTSDDGLLPSSNSPAQVAPSTKRISVGSVDLYA